jgi:two-component system, NarL family, invasion response regulator UvrY
MIRVIIADDHQLIREGIKKIVRAPRDIQIVGEAATLHDTLLLIEQKLPDMLILDISLPGHDGLEGLTLVRDRFPAIPVLILSMYPEERFAARALKVGAAGYLTKAMAAEELITAIRKIISGTTYISARLTQILASGAGEPSPGLVQHASLTERELQILAMLGAGKQVKQVAAALSISISSVNTYRSRIFRKMGLRSNAELIRYAVENSLIAR